MYRALTDPAQFSRTERRPASDEGAGRDAGGISPEVGGSFLLFGGYISGRHLELTPNVRIVQAWRSASWPPHIHSIARFELADASGGAKIVFDHTGLPNGEGASLASGWREHYRAPLTELLA